MKEQEDNAHNKDYGPTVSNRAVFKQHETKSVDKPVISISNSQKEMDLLKLIIVTL